MSAPRMWIVIPNWDSTPDEPGFQHYKDRQPIWIKNYTELLSRPDYLELTLPQRGLLHGIWLMYAEGRRSVPVSTSYLSRQLNGRVTKGMLDSLNHAGFITYSASKPLAPRYQDASPEVEVEKRREETPTPNPAVHADDDLDLEPRNGLHALPNLETVLKDIPA